MGCSVARPGGRCSSCWATRNRGCGLQAAPDNCPDLMIDSVSNGDGRRFAIYSSAVKSVKSVESVKSVKSVAMDRRFAFDIGLEVGAMRGRFAIDIGLSILTPM